MDKSQDLFADMLAIALERKIDSVLEEEVRTVIRQYAKLLGLLDVIWSKVRGIDGLVPTDEHIKSLDKAISNAKRLWLEMNLTTLQPKWHLTFDGHLLRQVINFGGLADKSDETIELQHQRRKKLKGRYRSVPTYKKKEACIRKEMKRQKSSAIQAQLDKYQACLDNLNRKRGPTEATLAKQEAKKQKREDLVA